MTNTTKNILLIGTASLLVAGGFALYTKGQHLDGKNALGRNRRTSGGSSSRLKEPTFDEIENFIKRATYSNTAYKNGIPNLPNQSQRENLIAVAKNVYFPLAYGLGVYPDINSGFRGVALNQAIGGSMTSQHMKGEAIDIDLSPMSDPDNNDIWRFIKNFIDFDQMILEFTEGGKPSWIHVSFKKNGGNRRKMNIAQKVNGKTKYYQFSEELFNRTYKNAA